VRSARAGQDAAAAQQLLARLELRRDVTIAFAEAIAADRMAEISRDRARIAMETRVAVQRRFAAGLESELQLARIEVEAGSAQAMARRAGVLAMAARRHLAQFWRDDTVTEPLEVGWFDALSTAPLPSASLDSHPRRLKARHELAQATAQLAAERARRIPVVTANIGLKRFPEAVDGEDQAFVLGLSIPLPFWDRNAEGIANARAQLLRAELAEEAAGRELRATQASMTDELDAALLEVRALVEHGVPAAQSAAELSRQGYAAGRVPLLDRLAAEAVLAEEREKLEAARLAVHRARAALASLVDGQD
jgi:cobalt-zinc-cadmium efflux system outer membrane protein